MLDGDEDEVFAPNARRGGWRCVLPAKEDTKEILHAWHTHRYYNMGLATIDDGHKCTMNCVLSGALVVISEEQSIYGCVNSGAHHVCALDNNCELLKTSMDGGIWCLFSNRFVETFVNQTRFGTPLEPKEINIRENIPDEPYDAPDERMKRKQKRAAIREERAKAARMGGDLSFVEPETFTRPLRVRFGLQQVKESAEDVGTIPQDEPVVMHAIMGTGERTHQRSGGEESLLICDSRSAVALKSKSGTVVTEAKKTRVRLKGGAGGWRGKEKLRQPTLPLTRGGGTRKVLDLVETKRSLFLYSVPPKEFYNDHTESDIRKIVAALFEPALRQEIHKEQEQTRTLAAAAAIQQYRAACYSEGARPCAHQSDVLVRMTSSNIPQVSTVHVNGAEIQEYAHFVSTMWRLILATRHFENKPNTFRLLNHTLGCLYMMQLPLVLAASDGSGIDETVTETSDKFLMEHLPPPQLLYNWNPYIVLLSAPRIIAVKGNPGNRVAYNMSLISTGRNTIKTALLSLDTQQERSIAAKMLREALPR